MKGEELIVGGILALVIGGFSLGQTFTGNILECDPLAFTICAIGLITIIFGLEVRWLYQTIEKTIEKKKPA